MFWSITLEQGWGLSPSLVMQMLVAHSWSQVESW